MRLIDADAYAKEMRERQDACEAAINAEGYEGETFSLRQHWEGVFAAFVEAKLTLDSMPTVEMPGWISVQDRLPEKDGEYLVRLRHGGMKVIRFTHDLRKVDDYQFKRKKPGWYEFDSEWGYVERDDITHYMPLPEPPKEV